ncbi:MAG: cytochrome b/b6 domain-containing protein, partial [Methylophilus sp.]
MNMNKQVVVWDIPVRIFHWLLVVSFAGAWLSAESEKYQLIHYAFGYTAGALVLFRIIWGFVGTKYARFYDFIKGPKAII